MAEYIGPMVMKTPDEKVNANLGFQPGDIAIVAMRTPPKSEAVGVFVYEDGSVNIVGCQSNQKTIDILEAAASSLRLFQDAMDKSAHGG